MAILHVGRSKQAPLHRIQTGVQPASSHREITIAASLLEIDSVLDGRYRIQRVLGHGGMGTVYMAHHEALDREVAVKEVRGDLSDADTHRLALEQSRGEASLLVQLRHQYLPQVMDAFVENDRFYLVMEYIKGQTIEEMISIAPNNQLPIDSVVNWAIEIAEVLTYLHVQEPPIIFRDLKPSNVMVVPDGSIRLIDFGIARRFHPGAGKDTTTLGSIGYAPPEQFGRGQTDGRSDLFALGAMLHQLLTGRHPADSTFKFPSVLALNPSVPAALSALIDECIALKPEERPETAEDVLHRLVSIKEHMPKPGTDPPKDLQAIAQKEKSPKREIWLMALLPILVLAVFGYIIWQKSKPASKKPDEKKVEQPISVDPQTTPKESAPKDPPKDGSGIQSVESSAELSVESQSVVSGTEGALLRVMLKGQIKGKRDSTTQVGLLFFDGSGNLMTPREPGSRYADQHGQLSVGQDVKIPVDADRAAIYLTLEVPIAQFPTNVEDIGVKMRPVALVNDKLIGQGEFVDVPADRLVIVNPPSTNGAPSSTPGGP